MTDTVKLSNGITLVVDERQGSQKVAMAIGIHAGSKDDDIETPGLTFLTQEATNGGTVKRSRDQIANEAESLGTQIVTEAGDLYTEFKAEALKTNASRIFDILADMVRHPKYDESELEKTKKQILFWIEDKNQSPSARASEQLMSAAYSDQPIATETMGDPDLLKTFSPKQVKDRHQQLLSNPEDIVISFSGDISLDDAKKLAENYFGDLTQSSEPIARKALSYTGKDHRVEEDNAQLNLNIGFQAPGLHDPDFYALIVFDELFSGGMSAPLFQEIREKRGLVYGVHSFATAYDDNGLFYVRAGTGQENARELIEETIKLLGRVMEEGFSEEDIKAAQKRMMHGRQSLKESTMTSAVSNMYSLFRRGYVVSDEQFKQKIESVTSTDVQNLIHKMLSSGQYAFGGVGPHANMPAEAEIKALMAEQSKGYKPKPASIEQTDQDSAGQNETSQSNVSYNDPQVTKLANGMRVVTVERPGPLSCGAWVGAGTSHETEELNGATHMNEHMMFKGTPSYQEGEIDRIIEGKLAGALNAYTSYDQTAYYFYELEPDDLEEVIGIAAEMVFEANITQEDFDGPVVKDQQGNDVKYKGERDVVVEEINMYNDSVGSRMHYQIRELAYPDQAAGRPILGTEDTLRAMTAEDLRAYRDQYYSSNNVTFVASGSIKHEDHVAMVEKKLGHLTPTSFPPMQKPHYVGGTQALEMKQAGLVNIGLAFDAVSASDERNDAYELLGLILSKGESSHLTQKLVYQSGLVGNIYSGLLDYTNEGLFFIGTEGNAENLKTILHEIYSTLSQTYDDLTQADLDKAKALLEMTIRKSMDRNRDVARNVGMSILQTDEALSLDQRVERFNAVTIDDVRKALESILESNPTLSMVLPEGTDHSLIPDHDDHLKIKEKALRPDDEHRAQLKAGL